MNRGFREIMEQANRGKDEWRNLIKEFNINDNDYLFLLPNTNDEMLYYSLLYLSDFMRKDNLAPLIITTEQIITKCEKYFGINTAVKIIDEEAMNTILSFYNLYMFTDKLIILSPTQPNGRSAYNLVEQGIIDIEEFISVGILQNREFQRVPLITYEGDDPELAEFFNVTRKGEKL
ncbi:hypothetical protein [Metasolibacillus meyeri]|uniref:hypothetical protein n=1 Tax=Metasolibacillus meyeri TaxID=1071052 RepID=UPI000D307F01|nr:hypothetical protein [Metasolibacillus meyeri]